METKVGGPGVPVAGGVMEMGVGSEVVETRVGMGVGSEVVETRVGMGAGSEVVETRAGTGVGGEVVETRVGMGVGSEVVGTRAAGPDGGAAGVMETRVSGSQAAGPSGVMETRVSGARGEGASALATRVSTLHGAGRREVEATRAGPLGSAAASGGSGSGGRDGIDATMAGGAPGEVEATLEATRATRTRAAAAVLSRGALVGRYVIIGRLGAGAMGVVYAAFDPELDRKIALKLLQPEIGAPGSVASADARSRLLREAQALARLSHPNVVGVHDVGVHGDEVWIAMEFVEGQTLGRWLGEKRRSWGEIAVVLRAVGEGLAAAHAAGLVHRDVKPDNVMVGDDGRARVMDFGLARGGESTALAELGASGATLLSVEFTQAGALVGTPAYMAPEQFLGTEVGPAADVFAFSVTFWEALHGERPFAGENLAGLRANVLAGRRRPPRRRDAPRWLTQVLAGGLAVDPARRWGGLRELLGELSRREVRSRRARYGFAALGVAALVASGVGLHVAGERRAIAACAAEGAAIEAVWSAGARASIGDAFAATGRPAAAETLGRTLPWLDRWAASWSAATNEACLAHRVEGRWDADLDARARECLDEARGSFAALVDELAAADAITLVRATPAAASLDPVDGCVDPERLAERPALSPADQARTRGVRVKLARAASLDAAGRYKEALAAGEEALAEARAAAMPSLVADALVRVATIQADLGDLGSAEASLGEALAAAGEARAPRTALTAMIRMVALVGSGQTRFAEAKVWGQAARTQLGLLGGDDRLAAASLDANLALVLDAEGKFGEAVTLHERAIAGFAAALGEDHPQVAVGVECLAKSRGSLGEHQEAATLLRRALAIREVALGPDHPLVAESLGDLADEVRSLRDFDEALPLLERSLRIQEAALGPDHPGVVAALNRLANLYTSRRGRGDVDTAMALYERALAISEADADADRRALGKLHYNLGLLALQRHDFEVARRGNERAIALFEGALGPNHPLVAYAVEGLADSLTGLERQEEAVGLWERAVAIREAAYGPDNPELAVSLSRFANFQYQRKAYAEALALDTRAAAILARHPHPARVMALTGLGRTLVAMNRAEEAVAPLEEALGLFGEARDSRAPVTLFTLAKALWDARRDRRRAVELVRSARAIVVETGRRPEEVEELDAWLATHRI